MAKVVNLIEILEAEAESQDVSDDEEFNPKNDYKQTPRKKIKLVWKQIQKVKYQREFIKFNHNKRKDKYFWRILVQYFRKYDGKWDNEIF